MPKITDLLAPPAPLTGLEKVPIVQGDAMWATNLGGIVGAVAQPFVEAAQAGAVISAGAAGTAVAARDASAIYKTGAEAAQAGAQAAAVLTAADRTQTGADRVQIASDRLAITSWMASVVAPVLNDMYDVNGQVRITDYTLPINDYNLTIGPKNGVANQAPGYGIYGSTGKFVGINRRAGAESNSYDSSCFNWNAGAETVGDFQSVYGVHCNEKTNKAGRPVYGFGTRASGSFTLTGDPTAGKKFAIAGLEFTFVAGASAVATEVQIAAGDTTTTVARMAIALYTAATNAIEQVMWRANGNVLDLLAEGAGEWANAIALTTDDPAVALSGATMAGGTTQTNDGNSIYYIGASALGVSANKNASPMYPRPAQGAFRFGTNPVAGDWIALGIGDTFNANAATAKQISYVTSGATTLQVNLGGSEAESICNLVTKLRAIQAGYTELNRVDYWMARGHMRLVYKTSSITGNVFKTWARIGGSITPVREWMWGGVTSRPNADCALGMNSEFTIGGDNLKRGYSGGRFARALFSVFDGAQAGVRSSGNYCHYGPNNGNDLIGSFNAHLASSASPAATDGPAIAISSITSDGVITLASNIVDPVGRIIGEQKNWTQTGGTIKGNGSNIGNPTLTCVTIAPDKLQIIDTSDTDTATVYSITGSPSAITLAPRYARADYSSARYGTAEDRTELIGSTNQRFAKVMSDVLAINSGRFAPAIIVNGVAAVWRLLFPTALANLADGDTISIQGGTGFTIVAKTTANLATANTSTRLWFEIGANMYQTLRNAAALLNALDDGSTQAAETRRARYSVQGQTGSGFFLVARIVRDTGGNTWTMACSNAGIGALSQVTTGTTGNLPLASAIKPPANNELCWVSASPINGATGPANYVSSADIWRFH